jgi:enediyne biosynthesis protein E4
MLTGSESNRDGLGAVCRVEIGDQISTKVHNGKSGYLSQSRLSLCFGLGESEQADRIVVEWPSGKRQVSEGPIPSNQAPPRLVLETEITRCGSHE